LYWRGTTRAGVVAGLVTGTLVTVAWQYTPFLEPLLYELVPAFVASLIVTVAVSRITSPPHEVDLLFTSMEAPADRSPPTRAR
jgi:Na+/proline symporter